MGIREDLPLHSYCRLNKYIYLLSALLPRALGVHHIVAAPDTTLVTVARAFVEGGIVI